MADDRWIAEHRDSRQLGRTEERIWYAIAAVTYIVAGLMFKGLLNWFVGPLWLVFVVWWGPAVLDKVRRR